MHSPISCALKFIPTAIKMTLLYPMLEGSSNFSPKIRVAASCSQKFC